MMSVRIALSDFGQVVFLFAPLQNKTIMEKYRKFFSNYWKYSFSFLFLFSSLSCFSQKLTTNFPDGIGLRHIKGDGTTYDYAAYVFELNDEGRISVAMVFVNDTIHISPYILHDPSESLFNAVVSHEFAHYYNYLAHDEIIKTDTSKQDVQAISAYWKKSPDLKRIIYKGGDGSSVYQAIIIKKTTSLQETIAAEYAYIEKELGQRGINWKPLGQYLHPSYSKRYDII